MRPNHNFTVFDVVGQHFWNFADFHDGQRNHYSANAIKNEIKGQWNHYVSIHVIQHRTTADVKNCQSKVGYNDDSDSKPKDSLLVTKLLLSPLDHGFELNRAEEVLEAEQPMAQAEKQKAGSVQNCGCWVQVSVKVGEKVLLNDDDDALSHKQRPNCYQHWLSRFVDPQ